MLLAHPRLLENCTGRVKSYNLIHNNGIYMIKSTQQNLYDGIYTIHLHNAILRCSLHKAICLRLFVQWYFTTVIRATTAIKSYNYYKNYKGQTAARVTMTTIFIRAIGATLAIETMTVLGAINFSTATSFTAIIKALIGKIIIMIIVKI